MKDGLINVAIVVGVVLVAMIALNFLWDRKHRPMQIKKGIATATFSNILNRAMRYLFIEDKARKVISFRDYYIVSIIATLVFAFIGNFAFAGGTFALFILIAFGRARQAMHARHAIFMRMFDVAKSRLSYDRNAPTNPWAWVKVSKWEDKTTPGKVTISFPPSFRIDSPKAREEFQQHFDGTITEDNAWTYDWHGPEGIVICEPVPPIPAMAPYPGSAHRPWDEIPLGIGVEGEIVWKLNETPHLLVCGTTGGGKSVLQRNIIFHVIQHSNDIKFMGIDLKRVELSPFLKYDQAVIGIARDLEDGVEVMRYGRDEMERRYSIMEEAGVTHFRDLPEHMPALLIMIDEAAMFLGAEGVKTDEGKMRDELHGEATTILGAIARLGRAAGVHLVVATQRPDAKIIFGEIKANLSARYLAGRSGSTPSLMILDSDIGTRVPGHIQGRGVIQFNGAEEFIQGYFAKQDWIDKWLAKRDQVSEEDSIIEDASSNPSRKEKSGKNKAGKSRLGMFGRKLNFRHEENENPIANLPENTDHQYDGVLEQIDPGLEAYEDRIATERTQGPSRRDMLMQEENIDIDMSVPESLGMDLPTSHGEGYSDEGPLSMLPPENEQEEANSTHNMPAFVSAGDGERQSRPVLPTWDDDLDDIFSELPYNKPSDNATPAVVGSNKATTIQQSAPAPAPAPAPTPTEATTTSAPVPPPARSTLPPRPTPPPRPQF